MWSERRASGRVIGCASELTPDPAQLGKRCVNGCDKPVDCGLIKLIARDVVDRRGEHLDRSRQFSSHHGRLELFLHSFVWHQSAEHETRAVALCRLDVVQCCLAAARQTVRGSTGCGDLRASRSTPEVLGGGVTNVDDFVIKKGISEDRAPPAGLRSVCHAPQSTRPTPDGLW